MINSNLKSWLEKGQSIMEYAVLLAVVSAAFFSMALYVKRAVQGQLFTIEDRTVARMNQTPDAQAPPGPPI